MLTNLYHRCKSQENLPKEKVQNFIRELYAPFTEEDLNIKMIELLRPTGVDTEIHMVYLSIEDLHKACPNSPGDWYFSGYYPTPGGNKCVNAAFIRYMETHQAELLS